MNLNTVAGPESNARAYLGKLLEHGGDISQLFLVRRRAAVPTLEIEFPLINTGLDLRLFSLYCDVKQGKEINKQ